MAKLGNHSHPSLVHRVNNICLDLGKAYNGPIYGSGGTSAESCLGVGWSGKSGGGAPDSRGGGEGEQLEGGDQGEQGGRGSHPGEGGPGSALYSQAGPGGRLDKAVRSILAARWAN